ncbi:MAG: BrnT family toxin [Alphaproteobacteria bacterium]|nr:BrnT family toxin [Alphaproteobacteria bacterium]
MSYEWDESKRLSNLKKHGVDFADIEEFDWPMARFRDDILIDHEQRFKALSYFRGRLHLVIFTLRGKYAPDQFQKSGEARIREYEEEAD